MLLGGLGRLVRGHGKIAGKNTTIKIGKCRIQLDKGMYRTRRIQTGRKQTGRIQTQRIQTQRIQTGKATKTNKRGL
eukprot:13052924-Ditylum_brightwellii.AAC.1